jgi:hypothetical protein
LPRILSAAFMRRTTATSPRHGQQGNRPGGMAAPGLARVGSATGGGCVFCSRGVSWPQAHRGTSPAPPGTLAGLQTARGGCCAVFAVHSQAPGESTGVRGL